MVAELSKRNAKRGEMTKNPLLMAPIEVLLIEDNPGDARLIQELLSESGANEFSLIHADRLSEGLERLSEGGIDAVLLDLSLPDSYGLATLTTLYSHAPGLPILVLTDLDDEALGLEAVQSGAQDYLVKGHADSDLLARSLRYAIMRKYLEDQKDNFITLASHELRTPIAIIRGSAQLALRVASKSGDEKLSHTLETINNQTGRMARLINDLLEAPLIPTNPIPFYPEPFDLCHLVEAAVTSMQPINPSFTFVLDLPSTPTIVNADYHRIEQVITNLVHNAIKYSADNQCVEITVRLVGDEVVTAVRDFGVGVPTDQQSQVFERFFRGRNLDTKHYGGLGLGLFISHSIVVRHRGRMWLQSVEREGSTFYFTLPLVPNDKDDADDR